MNSTLSFPFQKLKRHKFSIAIVLLINFATLYQFVLCDQVLHGIGYFVFFFCAIGIIHVSTSKVKASHRRINNPGKEFFAILVFMIIGTAILFLNFYLNAQDIKLGGILRIPLILSMLTFTFPVGITIYLWVKKYRLPDFGFKLKPLYMLIIGIIIWGITGLFAWMFYPEGILWSRAMEEMGGIIGIILQGVIGAALAEELWRYLVQTRLNILINQPVWSILIASTLWSLMHIPVTFFKTESIISTLGYCLQIIPLGIVWGYLTHRTMSIIPSIIVHGLNLWGFQNG